MLTAILVQNTIMAAALTCRRVIASVFPNRLVLTTNRLVQDARHLISMSQSIQSSDAPKKPPRPFVKFLREKYSEMKTNNPGISWPEAIKTAGHLWRQLGPEGQSTYRLQGQEEYEDYKQKYFVFLNGLGKQQAAQLLGKSAENASSRELKRRKEMRRLGKPKWPPNAYQLFMRSSWLDQSGVSVYQFSKVLADNWRNMPKEEKKKYEEDARLEKEKYEKELKEWKERMNKVGCKDLIHKSSCTLTQPKRTKSISRYEDVIHKYYTQPKGKKESSSRKSHITFVIPPEFR